MSTEIEPMRDNYFKTEALEFQREGNYDRHCRYPSLRYPGCRTFAMKHRNHRTHGGQHLGLQSIFSISYLLYFIRRGVFKVNDRNNTPEKVLFRLRGFIRIVGYKYRTTAGRDARMKNRIPSWDRFLYSLCRIHFPSCRVP